MMATTARQLAIDAFGPIADNAGGIAEMSGLPDEVRERTDILDSVGNTTAAVGKGFAIASAALTALALFAAYVTFTGIDGINIFKAKVLAALFVGGMIPVVFSALAMRSVGKAAMEMVKEVRRQFREIPGIMEGTGTPEYGKCVDISTKAALKEMMLPGAITIVSPIIIGFAMGPEALGSYMAGVLVSGVLWAIFQNNAGGAWDNAKKSFEAGVMIDGNMTHKGSEAHKAAVTGDTVGDPFKDTSGPSMNILIKLTCLVGLVIAPILGEMYDVDNGSHANQPKIEKSAAALTPAAAAKAVAPSVAKKYAGKQFTARTKGSTVTWKGDKLIGDSHEGLVQVKQGNMTIQRDGRMSGKVIIDMTSITNTDIKDKSASDLVGHLKAEDFFNVAKFPTAELTIKSEDVSRDGPFKSKAKLTLLGKTNDVKVKGEFTELKSGLVQFDGEFLFDRTDFGLTYGSKGSFADLAKDRVIQDDVTIRTAIQFAAQ